MADRNEMLRMLEEEKEIRENRVIAEKDGSTYVNFHDAAVLNNVNSFDPQGTGLQERNADGSLASTGKRVHALNPDFYFMNRYRLRQFGQKKKLYIVSGHTPEGFRLIQEQSTGRCFMKSIPVAIVSRDAETKELVFEKMDTVSESEFIGEFTKTLDNKSMAEILPLIVGQGSEVTADEMPI